MILVKVQKSQSSPSTKVFCFCLVRYDLNRANKRLEPNSIKLEFLEEDRVVHGVKGFF